ncbi:MAG TPA: hypothetical protein VMV14_04060 [Acidimicrobiales bacterium]|nr:hypothetical protein [Acidimicrobiales bacterium]
MTLEEDGGRRRVTAGGGRFREASTTLLETVGDGVLGRLTAARLFAVIYLTGGGLVAVVSALVPQQPGTNFAGVESVAISTFVTGAVAWWLPWNRWPQRASVVLAILAFGCISAFDAASIADGYRYGLFYIVIFAWIGLAQPRGTSLLITPAVAVAYSLRSWPSATAGTQPPPRCCM